MILEKPTKNKNEKEMVNINDVPQYSNEKKHLKRNELKMSIA